ncbi:MAG: hypothetical protein P8L39_11095, partial [Halioglobus sp.]|nr:hypothetical protein [Halioglobus sp.]
GSAWCAASASDGKVSTKSAIKPVRAAHEKIFIKLDINVFLLSLWDRPTPERLKGETTYSQGYIECNPD